MKRIIFFSILLLLFMVSCGCCKEANSLNEVKIIKELPKMYIQGNISIGTQKIIQKKEELLLIFSAEQLNKLNDLNQIDFDKQTLLIGYDSYPNEAELTYQLEKNTQNKYTLLVSIKGLATRPDSFLYGVVVSKVSKNIDIEFKIEKL